MVRLRVGEVESLASGKIRCRTSICNTRYLGSCFTSSSLALGHRRLGNFTSGILVAVKRHQ